MPSSKPLTGDRMLLGRRIREARVDQGYTQAEAARRLGVKVQSWQQWESGRTSPRPERLTDIARVLSVAVGDLLEPRHMFEPVTLTGKANTMRRNYQRARDSLGPYETTSAASASDLDIAPILGFAALPAEVQYHLRALVHALAAALQRPAIPSKKKGAA